jgi:hypothetical protein
VLVQNLGKPGSLLLDGVPLNDQKPTRWTPGSTLTLGVFVFTLEAVAEHDLNAPPDAPMTLTAVSAESSADAPADADAATEYRTHQPIPPTESATTRKSAPEPPPRLPEWTQFLTAVDPDKFPPATSAAYAAPPDQVTLPYTGAPLAAPPPSPAVPNPPRPIFTGRLPEVAEEGTQMTRYKEWREMGKLSAQCGLSTINFVPGERIRIPISVRSEAAHPLELLAHLAGLPDDWAVTAPAMLTIAPHETTSFDLIVQSQPLSDAPGSPPKLDAHLRLFDRVTSEIAISLPLTLTLKRQPDIVGMIEPERVQAGQPVYLALQNHTLATFSVALSVDSPAPQIRVVLPQTQVELVPNQKVRIPVNIEVLRPPRFRAAVYSYHLFTQQGTRAPLDFVGTVRVAPVLVRWLAAGVWLITGLGVIIFLLTLMALLRG